MRSGYSIEQVFVRQRGGIELTLILIAPSGAIKHDALSFSTRDESEAVRRAAHILADRGDVESADGLRLRVDKRGQLKDNKALKQLFVREFNISQGG